MPITTLMPLPKQQYLTVLGTPLASGKVYTYAAGTSNPKVTYADAAGTQPQPNPIPLNARGEPNSPIYWSGNYRVEVRDALGVLIYTVDNYNTDPAGLWGIFTQLGSSIGSSIVGYILNAVGATGRTVQAKLREQASLDDFSGVDPTGSQFSTDGIKAAFAWLSGGNRTLYGSPGAVYKINDSIPVTGTNVTFDGRECVIINAINANPAPPLFSITTGSGNFTTFKNFTVNAGSAGGKGHTFSVIGDGQSPQGSVFRNVRINSQVGNGKDKTGASMPAYAVYAYGVFTIECDSLYVQLGSGGIYLDTVQKALIRGTVTDTCTNYAVYITNSTSVFINDRCTFNGCGQAGQSQVFFDGCSSFMLENTRIKGGLGSQVKSGNNPSINVRVAGVHCEVYSNTDDCFAFNTACATLVVESVYLNFIGQGFTYTAGISFKDRVGGGTIGVAARVSGVRIIVGGADTLTNGILVQSTSNSYRALSIENVDIGGGGVSSIVTNAINLTGIGFGNSIRNVNLGNPGGIVTNGIVITSNQTSAWLDSIQVTGAVTNAIVDNGTLTRRYESGTFNMTLTDVSGTVTTGCAYERQGRTVTLKILTASGTSTSTTFQLTGLPSSIQPASIQWQPAPVIDSGSEFGGWAQIGPIGTITMGKTIPGGAFTSSGTKGVRACSITYMM